MLAARLEALLGIRRAEQKATGLLFLYAFGMSGAYVSARTHADALFLARAGAERLPAMILVSATSVTLMTALYAASVSRFPLRLIILLFHLGLAVSTITLTRLVNSSEIVAVSAGLYLLAELRGALGTIHFSTLLNELFQQSAPARVTGVASSGSTFAGILLGGTTGLLAESVGVSSLLYLVPLLDIVAGGVAWGCRDGRRLRDGNALQSQISEGSGGQESATDASQTGTAGRRILMHPLARYIALIVALKTAVVVLLEYEWKLLAVEELETEARLAAFFGEFYAALFLLTGAVQLLGTSRVLTGLGIRAALASFPACVGVVLLAVVVPGSQVVAFWGLTAARGCDVLRRGLTDAAIHLLYWPLSAGFRRQVIAFTGGWVKPITEAGTAALLIPIATMLPQLGLSLLTAGLCGVWLMTIFRGRYSERSQTQKNAE
jgi:ATP/ADP translocase